MVGINHGTFRNYYTGKASPSGVKLRAICEHFGVSEEDITHKDLTNSVNLKGNIPLKKSAALNNISEFIEKEIESLKSLIIQEREKRLEIAESFNRKIDLLREEFNKSIDRLKEIGDLKVENVFNDLHGYTFKLEQFEQEMKSLKSKVESLEQES